MPTGPVVFAGQKEPQIEVEVEQEELELAAVRQPIQEVIIVDQTNLVLRKLFVKPHCSQEEEMDTQTQPLTRVETENESKVISSKDQRFHFVS